MFSTVVSDILPRLWRPLFPPVVRFRVVQPITSPCPRAGDELHPEASIFEQYNAALARHVVEQLRPILESFARPAAGVQQRLFDVEQAAVYLGRTPQAVRLLIHRAKLPATKIDGKV